jgi:hypothetical protein
MFPWPQWPVSAYYCGLYVTRPSQGRCQYEIKPNIIVARPLYLQLLAGRRRSSTTGDLTLQKNSCNRIEWLGDTYRAVESFESLERPAVNLRHVTCLNSQETKSNSCFFLHRLGLSFGGRWQENALGRNGSAGGSGGRTESLEGQSAQPPDRAETILQSLFLRGLERTPPNRQPIGPEANGDPASHLVQILQLIALRRISNDKLAVKLHAAISRARSGVHGNPEWKISP